MEKASLHHLSQRLVVVAVAVVAVFSLLSLGSCANDEPDIYIDYYLTIQSKERIFRRGGLPPDPKEDVIGKLITDMRTKIKDVYPVPNMEGNDGAVLVLCDEIYRQYLETGFRDHTECVAILYRARMQGGIIRQSTKIKTYNF